MKRLPFLDRAGMSTTGRWYFAIGLLIEALAAIQAVRFYRTNRHG